MSTETTRLRIEALIALLRLPDPGGGQLDEALQRLLHSQRIAALGDLGAAELDDLQRELTRDAMRSGRREAIVASGVPAPIYNFYAGFDGNQEPWAAAAPVSLAASPPEWLVMGKRIGAPIGVPASGLTANSKWVRYLSDWGWNLITYKTVRSRSWDGHPFPQWLFTEPISDIDLADFDSEELLIHASERSWPKDWDHVSTVNSFGVPSPSPEVWQADIERCLVSVNHSNQLFMVSVMGSPEFCSTDDELADDYARAASQAVDAGAEFVELNLSCPNTISGSGKHGNLVCHDVSLSEMIVKRCVAAVASRARLAVKITYMHRARVRDFADKVGPYVAGISAINTLPVRVISPDTGKTPFDGVANDVSDGRETAGLSGAAVKALALDTVRSLAEVRADRGLEFSVIGIGGVMSESDIWSLHGAGADAVQTATGAALRPTLAVDYSRTIAERMVNRRTAARTPHSRWSSLGKVMKSGGLTKVFEGAGGR